MNNAYFDLSRLADDLIYKFDRTQISDDVFGYKRQDQDLWITYKDTLGWVAYDESTQSVLGRPWDIAPHKQSKTHPPEGTWVSRKGPKSYVYELQYKE